MANYNYVAPIQYKSYSDMNKERLAAKAVKDSERIKQRSTGDKQKQQYLDQLSGLSTKGWATSFRNELTTYVEKAEKEFNTYGGVTGYNPRPMVDGLIRMMDRGNLHAELNEGRLNYEAHLGPNAKKSKEDDWSTKLDYTADGHTKRLKGYNHAGMIDYNEETQLGHFPNPLYDPNASEGGQSKMTLKDRILEEGGAVDPNDGNFVITEDGKRVQVIGKAFDSPAGGMGGLWNADKIPVATHTAEDSFFNFEANNEGSSVFKVQADILLKKVESGDITRDEAHDDLYKTVLSFMTGQDPSASMRASAITKWEMENNGASWIDQELARSQTESDIVLETPFEEYAEAVADIPNLKKKPSGSGSDKWDAKMDLWMPVQDVNSYMGLDPETSGAVIGDNAIAKAQWDQMLGMNLGGDFGGQVIGAGIQSIKNDIETATQKALNISIPQAANMEYDEQYIDRVTYHPEDDYIFIWRTDPSFGQKGPLSEDSAWAYTKTGQGEERGLFFQVIYKWKGGKQPTYDPDGKMNNGAEWTQQYRDLRGNFKLRMPEDVSGTADPLQFLFDKAKQI
tara:strand:- start:6692 stop:8389 length:1698 start_codon:yes stop_codon:yes gene_type:complete